MAQLSEEVWARLSVTIPLAMGFAKARLVFTERRLIVAYWSKESSRMVIDSLWRFLVGIFKTPVEAGKLKRAESSSADELLVMDPENFGISYDEIVRMELARPFGKDDLALLTVLTKNEKLSFRLSSRLPAEFVDEMRKILGERFLPDA